MLIARMICKITKHLKMRIECRPQFFSTNFATRSELNLSKDTLNDIKENLKDLFQKIDLNVEAQENLHLEQTSSFGNQKFLYLMKFLEELKTLIINREQDKNINQDLDLILDKVREKLNEQIKTTLTTKILQKDSNKNIVKIKAHDPLDTSSSGDQSSYGKDISSRLDKSSKELRDIQTKKIDFGNLKNNELKADAEKKLSPKL